MDTANLPLLCCKIVVCGCGMLRFCQLCVAHGKGQAKESRYNFATQKSKSKSCFC